MALVKYKNPVEYSFHIWMANYPESTHPFDQERFLVFVRSVCEFNAKKWKSADFLEAQILEAKPNFDRDRLEQILIVFEYLVEFHRTSGLPRSWCLEEVHVEPGHYIERGYRNGEFYEEQKPIPQRS